MNINAEYIKMCRLATSLQRIKIEEKYDDNRGPIFETGEMYADDEDKIIVVGDTIYSPTFMTVMNKFDVDMVGYDEGDGYYSKTIAWIPRQDQLSELSQFKHKAWLRRVLHVMNDDTPYVDTIEKASLVAIMDELYSMHWNGTEWISFKEKLYKEITN